MPIYEFTCEGCGHLAEVMQKLSDPAPACPECGRERMARTVSRTSFQLKGGGWYADLYASKKPPATGGAKAEAGGGSGGGGTAGAGTASGGDKAHDGMRPAAEAGQGLQGG